MNIYDWARAWDVSHEAIEALQRMAIRDVEWRPHTPSPKPESIVQARVRSDAALKGGLLMRNNSGAYKPERGRFVRYGLANDSKEMNANTKSSDLIGITPVLITPEMVGRTIGQFTARECKKEGWVYRATDAERAQLNFINIVLSLGGDACFTTGGGAL